MADRATRTRRRDPGRAKPNPIQKAGNAYACTARNYKTETDIRKF